MKILVLNGPNLNLLGQREPGIYGRTGLEEILESLRRRYADRLELHTFQSNHVVLNAGAYTHTSIALHDAIRSVAPMPVVEVHLSNVHSREPFRHTSMIAAACRGVIGGFGADSYRLAIEALLAAQD